MAANFDLRRRFGEGRLHRFVTSEPTHGDQNNEVKNKKCNDQRQRADCASAGEPQDQSPRIAGMSTKCAGAAGSVILKRYQLGFYVIPTKRQTAKANRSSLSIVLRW